ncbi:nitrogen fixation protein NifW [Caldichromatium japonicum]|uniref:Nitrogenase-stabilizing/protective protein NifW n=1 Tax=Caldichromatium japonicum TaxID=2699430 RepID=A0A6G7VES3_9GAMM|nr:nitrogenase-stabilizing/protective protein NifW [Caldichromatium japonicum]QIK38539.1 nitrogen fixation protein NifW [Caldichromatium japonicum]
MNAHTDDFVAELTGLESAEDFLDYFGIDYRPAIVEVNRLHILKRFHDYLEAHRQRSGEPGYAEYRALLVRAYEDFVHSDAYTEKVMRVHQKAAGIARVSIASLIRKGRQP